MNTDLETLAREVDRLKGALARTDSTVAELRALLRSRDERALRIADEVWGIHACDREQLAEFKRRLEEVAGD